MSETLVLYDIILPGPISVLLVVFLGMVSDDSKRIDSRGGPCPFTNYIANREEGADAIRLVPEV